MNEAESDQNMQQKCPQCGAPLPSGVLAGLCPACLFKQGAAGDTAVPPETPPFQPPGVEEVARLFPQLEIIALIGKGGMGAVYRARQPALDRIVALKILPPQTAAGPGFVERFNREARALAKLNHPNIVAVYEFGQVNGLPYFVMEYVDGVNLRELERAGKLSPREALQIVPQICEALQFAHDEGIVHRDVKPENILLDKKGRVKIADFGIAKILGGAAEVDLTGTQSAIGTPHYMAPEQMEKPTLVDHRADIFSLGVVFYEMLTGELPLGKFSPPSSRKVEVDVRLDDVVLRTLEKDPERRYQHASQVKTAVDTIAGSTAPPPSSANATAFAQKILARDYTLNIGSCVRRAWALLKGQFWSFVGITALLLALLGFASSFGGASLRRGPLGGSSMQITSGLLMLLWGPLMGGLLLYFLKKIRGEPATVETAFSGFSPRFLHLFLAGFVTSLLIWLGFLCLILPGIYLLVAWTFTLPLVMDKELDFWSAMELSRKVVTKHWFKFLGFGIVLLLLMFAGALALGIGLFVASPLVLGAMMYAYEDVFGGATRATPPPVALGPSGTVVMPATPVAPPPAGGTTWTLAAKIGLAAVVLVIGVFVLVSLNHRRVLLQPQRSFIAPGILPALAVTNEHTPSGARFAEAEPAEPMQHVAFGAVTERELTNLATLNLLSGRMGTLPRFVAEQHAPEKVSAACAWLAGAGMDMAYAGGEEFYGMTRDMVTLKRDDWEDATPESVAESLHDTGQDIGATFGGSSLQSNPTNYTYGFKTRDGFIGLLQVTGFTENPAEAKIRYKLFQPLTNQDLAVSALASQHVQETLSARLEAASSISDVTAKNAPLAAIATDAASTGDLEIVKKALGQMSDITKRDAATRDAALLLAKRGLRMQAIEIAKGISNNTIRNQALGELAK